MEVKLIVLDGKHKDREIPLPETIFLIGRDRQCHLRPHCRLVSQLHCAVAAWAGVVRVRDLKSRNGTFLNGQRIDGEVPVENGDQLKVGSLQFRFRVTEDGSLAGAAITHEGEIGWLFDTSDEPAALLNQTEVGFTMSPVADVPEGKTVSAGKHLEDYVQQHRRHTS